MRCPTRSRRSSTCVFGVKGDGWFNVLHAAGDLPIGATVVVQLGGRPVRQRRADRLQRRQRPAMQDAPAASAAPGPTCARSRSTGPPGAASAWRPAARSRRSWRWPGWRCCPPEAGVAWIRRELTAHAFRGEVVVAGALGAMAGEYHDTGGLDPAALPADRTDGRRRGRGRRPRRTRGAHHAGPAAQPFLDHHRIDGTAVLPGVMGMEAFAEVARLLAPDWHGRRGRGRRLPRPGEVLPGRAAHADDHRAAAPRRRRPGRRVPAGGRAHAAGQPTDRSGRSTSPARCG